MSQATVSKTGSTTGKRLVADSFSSSVVMLGGLLLMQRGIGFLRSFYVCGALSPAEVGQWDLAFNFLTIVAPLSVLGIPGSFGRYVARYEIGGQQQRFLRHTLVVCLCLTAIACIAIYWFRSSIAPYFFGGSEHANLVAILAIGLPSVVFFNFATSWFTSKRLNRVVFRIQFAQTLFFACGCVLAFQMISVSAVAVIIAYFVSCVVGQILAISYACLERGSDHSSQSTDQTLSIWSKVLPFAVWVWITNTLTNLFSLCDRLLLVNFHPDKTVDIQSLIGQYHTACIFPLLLLTLGAMAGSMLIPYLSKDWESGDRDSVTDRMNMMLKAIGLLCISASIGVYFFAPLLFGEIWKDKFAMGESLLPMTLCYCSLGAMTFVAQKYFWCIEKTWYSSSVMLVGLVANFSLGVALIGPFGIDGVVASTLAAHAIVLTGVLGLCARRGLQIDIGVFLVGASLLAICGGKLITCVCFAVLVAAAIFTQVLFTDSFKQLAIAKLRTILHSLVGNLS